VPTAHYRFLAMKPSNTHLQSSLPAAPAGEDLPLPRGAPAALTQFDG